MEAEPIENLLGRMIRGNLNDSNLPQHISATKPQLDSSDNRLHLRIFSPVSLDIYDSVGNHTGKVNNPVADSDIELKEENIPNSYYHEYGDDKFAGLDTEDTYQIKLHGLGLGSFTFEIEEVHGDDRWGS
ncbi:MAG: hypothetical protein AB1352_02145 [Patescibacteria group bacterium]